MRTVFISTEKDIDPDHADAKEDAMQRRPELEPMRLMSHGAMALGGCALLAELAYLKCGNTSGGWSS